MNPITLYVDSQYASPYAMSVYVTLVEKKFPFDVETVDLGAGAQHEPLYRKKFLTAKVPALEYDGFFLSESSAIIEYLEELCPAPNCPPVLPQTIPERARARQIQAWLRSDLVSIRSERPTEVLFFGERYPPLSPAAQTEVDKLTSVVEVLLAHGDGNLFGDWSIADTELALMLNRLVLNGDEMPKHLVDYATAQWERPTVQKWVKKERG